MPNTSLTDGFLTEVESVYCAVRTDSLYNTDKRFEVSLSAGIVEYIVRFNRNINSKWQYLICAASDIPVTVRDDARK